MGLDGIGLDGARHCTIAEGRRLRVSVSVAPHWKPIDGLPVISGTSLTASPLLSFRRPLMWSDLSTLPCLLHAYNCACLGKSHALRWESPRPLTTWQSSRGKNSKKKTPLLTSKPLHGPSAVNENYNCLFGPLPITT